MPLTVERLWDLLQAQPCSETPGLSLRSETSRGAYRELRGTLRAAGQNIPFLMILPSSDDPYPAVLYCHAHGNRYTLGAEELTEGRPSLQSPYGPTLAELGIASLAIDLAPFGQRQAEGPETALAKAAHWHGQCLMGRMLAELSAAFAALSTHPQIDGRRIATLGFSMGATHAYWMAALHPQIRAAAHLCAFADIGPLIATGAHDLHGPYVTVPGLMADGDMGDIAALMAPRPQLICAGVLDPLTPDAALTPALAKVQAAYGQTDGLHVHLDPDVGHTETPEMRAEVLRFLRAQLFP